MPDMCGPKLPKVPEGLEIDINLAHNTNLRSIELGYGMIALHPPRLIAALTYQIICRNLEHLTMSFALYSIADLDIVDWLQMEDLFNKKQWPNLRKLKIALYTNLETIPVAIKSIRDRLPVLEARGFLEVEADLR
jgi:hypothetical protein